MKNGLDMLQPHLFTTPSVPIWKKDNFLLFDRKFYDGMLLYVKKWPGKITCIISLSSEKMPDFGIASINKDDIPFNCIVLENNQLVTTQHLQGASIVLASGDSNNQFHISKLCKKENIKCIYIIEYISETRYQIASLSTTNPIIKLRRFFYIWSKERKRLAAFQLCDGLQSNGVPAHNRYNFVGNNLLYFDTRVYGNQIISDEALQLRLNYLLENNPLRIAFSGRLIRMKGADHLVKLALKLKQVNIPFQFTIYGTGDLDDEMKEYIATNQLENDVNMPGSVDFYNTLLPELKQSVDLFVCLHRQSDPSCTYLETFSCGIPIVGYNNRAFTGLLALADVGWEAELDDIEEVCKVISHLNKNRTELLEKSKTCAVFARNHDFDATFQKRIDHLLSTVNGNK